MFLVAGATGQTGRATAESLLQSGKPVTVLVRSADRGAEWKSKGTELAIGSLDNTESLASALAGKEGAYLLLPPNYAATDFIEGSRKVTDSMAKAVQQSKIPHVVMLSSLGAEHSSGTGPIVTLHNAEEAMRPAARNLTILRASLFLEEWRSVLGAAREAGVLPSFLTPGRKAPMIATRDIGAIVARSLIEPANGQRTIMMAAPQDYTPEEIATGVGSVLNKQITVQFIPTEAAVGALTAEGLPEGIAKLLAEMYEAINSGRVGLDPKAKLERGKVTPAEVIRELLEKQAKPARA